MATKRAKKPKSSRHTRLLDNPLFDTAYKHSSAAKALTARLTKSKTPAKAKLMTNTLFRSARKHSGYGVKSAKIKAITSVRSVVSRLKNVRKAHQEHLRRAGPRRSAIKAVTFSGDHGKVPVKRNHKTNKRGVNSFCYWLGATLSGSKTIFASQKAG